MTDSTGRQVSLDYTISSKEEAAQNTTIAEFTHSEYPIFEKNITELLKSFGYDDLADFYKQENIDDFQKIEVGDNIITLNISETGDQSIQFYDAEENCAYAYNYLADRNGAEWLVEILVWYY